MTLTLEVTGPQAARLGTSSRKIFHASGGSIGRLSQNDWALPDSFVSSQHALISLRDGVFYIEDTSRNGISINSQDNRLVKGTPHPLKPGDWIFIEPYEIKVSIAAEDTVPPSPFADLFSAGSGRAGQPFEIDQSPGEGQQLDPLALLGFGPRSTPPPAPRAADLGRGSVLSDQYRAPAVPEPSLPAEPAPGLIPDNWLNLDRQSAVPRPGAGAPVSAQPKVVSRASEPPAPEPPPEPGRAAPSPPPRPAPARGRDAASDLADVLAGAGLDGVTVTPELARDFGRILRVVVGGVIDMMDARRRIKREFRLGLTEVKPVQNNPLKFSVNTDDALHNLLVKRNAAFIGPVEAFEDAFDDVRNHQIAMLLAMRVAFDAMLAKFDPERLQEEFDHRSGEGSLLSVPAKLRYWDQYREKIRDMVRDADAGFRELFGDEFGRAYEEQLKRLKAQGRQP